MTKADIEKRREKLRRAIIRVVKASREDADFTRKELATRLGWTDEQVKNLETGKRTCAAEDLIMIADILKIEAGELVRRIQRW